MTENFFEMKTNIPARKYYDERCAMKWTLSCTNSMNIDLNTPKILKIPMNFNEENCEDRFQMI